MEKLVWQLFILGLGNIDIALKNGVGGVILFADDIENEKQLTESIKSLKSKAIIPPFISIDQEGGRVERTEKIRSKRLSAKFAYEKGCDFLKHQSEEISQELANWGFNLNFAPCVDVNSNPQNPIIGERSFSSQPEDVIKGAEIFIDSSRKFNVIPCIKHFPGHGDADKDSHLTLPKIDLEKDKMQNTHIKPFKFFAGKNIEMIMVAHLHCTCFDKEEIPTTLSQNAIGYLRKELNYNGVLISDDMFMKGIQKYGMLEAVTLGLKAGLDMFIFRNSNIEVINMIENLCKLAESDKELQELIINANRRVKQLKLSYNIL